jgi:hypothetical protein
MLLVDSLGKGLWEGKSKLNQYKIGRIIFFTNNNTLSLVHGLIKKTQKPPDQELTLAII